MGWDCAVEAVPVAVRVDQLGHKAGSVTRVVKPNRADGFCS
jgi:hypothetical protein